MTANTAPQKEFYKYGLLEMIHELGNVIQKMICVSYEMESNGADVSKLNSRINVMTQMIKIYTGIYTRSRYSFQEMLEMIQILHNSAISLEGNFMSLHEESSAFFNLERIILIYCMWISKRYEIKIHIHDTTSADLFLPDGIDAEKLYAISADSDSVYSQMLSQVDARIEIHGKRIKIYV